MISKQLLEFCIQETINEGRGLDWFVEKKCAYISQLQNLTRINKANTQSHIGTTNNGCTVHWNIRGSDETKDWFGPKGNFNFDFVTKKVSTRAKVSRGFLSAWKDIKAAGIDYIKSVDPAVIVISGHSRGAAAAAIGAENLAFKFPTKKVIGVYLSSPMPGNDEFSKLHSQRVPDHLHAWVTGDPVVGTPPWICGYRSVENGWSHSGKIGEWPWFFASHFPTSLQKVVRENYA